jgi:hypothetical protein
MSFLATTRGAVLRGSTTDALGDEVAGDIVAPGLDDFALGLIERSRQEFDPASGARRTIVYFVGRVPSNLQLEDDDLIRDNRTGKVYAVDGEPKSTPRGISGMASLTLTLRLTRG